LNVAAFLTPKSKVVWVRTSSTLAEAIRRMQQSGYAAIPVLGDDGGYAGTLTEGDVLAHLLTTPQTWSQAARRIQVARIARRTDIRAVHIDADVDALVARAAQQNFVPLVDDREIFIGIVRRQAIIEHCARLAGLNMATGPRSPAPQQHRGVA
jgi:CBS domain containing-hemolysin-like protein